MSSRSGRDHSRSRSRTAPTIISESSSEGSSDYARSNHKRKEKPQAAVKTIVTYYLYVRDVFPFLLTVLFTASAICYGIANLFPWIVTGFLTWAGAFHSMCGACFCANQNRTCQCVDGPAY